MRVQTSTAAVCHSLLPYVRVNLEGKNKATVASRFRDQLLDLVQRLDCTEMHFVRCARNPVATSPLMAVSTIGA
jgi:myosin heavy subunit